MITEKKKVRRWVSIAAASLALIIAMSNTPEYVVSAIGNFDLSNQNEATVAPTAQLRSLLIDRAYLLTPTGDTTNKDFDVSGFNSEHFNYSATVYNSYDSIKIYPFKFATSTATVTVNNQTVEQNGYYELDVTEIGMYSVQVKVKENGQTNTYNIQIEKVDEDYRGRKSITDNQEIMENMKIVSMTSPSTDPNSTPEQLMTVLKKTEIMEVNTGSADTGTYWKPSDSNNAYFIIDLGDVYDISRIRAMLFPRNQSVKASISVSADNVEWTATDTSKESEGISFETIINKGSGSNDTNWHQDVVRYDFNKVYPVRYIKWELNGNINNFQIHQFMIFEDTQPAPETYEAPENGSTPYTNEERHQYLSTGQATVIERGFPILGWMPSDGYGRDIPRPNESEELGWDGPLFYDSPTANISYLEYNPNSLWGLSKAPGGQNGMPSEDPPGTEDRPLIPDSLLPYVNNAISFCFGDEQNYSTTEVQKLQKWFEYSRERFPGVIVHTNNRASDTWANKSNLDYYIKTAQPDLLTWDDYYNNENGDKDGGGAGTINIQNDKYHGSAIQAIFANSQKWQPYRQSASEGIDKTGNQPILYGQYLDSFQTNQPESIKNLIANLSVLSGQKWLNFFRVEFQYDKSFLWDEDGTPTTGTWEWGQIADNIHAMDEWTNRLNNDWILVKKGTGTEYLSQDQYRLSLFVDSQEQLTEENTQTVLKQKEYGIKDIDVAVDTTRVNHTVTGDVAVGLAGTLPGLYEDEIAEWFEGSTAPKSFMILNGLVDGKTGDDETIKDELNQRYESSCFNPYVVEREEGSANNTRQTIKVTIEDSFSNIPLYRLNTDKLDNNGNATVERVELQQDQNGNYYIETTLGGGEMNVYFWGINTTSIASSYDAHGKQASFAFDNYYDTYWQASDLSSSVHTVENTFSPQSMENIVINEKGNNISSYDIFYKTVESQDEWIKLNPQDVGLNAFNTIGEETVLTLTTPKNNVIGIKLQINSTNNGELPAIHEISLQGQAQLQGTVSINDNDIGSGLYRFEYDGKWSYREIENGTSSIYPRNGDGHFASNYADAKANLRFWGYELTLDLRQNKVSSDKSKLQFTLYDQNGAEIEVTPVWDDSAGTVTFTMPNNEDGAYMISIVSNQIGVELGIDGADIKYNIANTNPIEFTGLSAPVEDPYQVYLNDKVTNKSNTDYFTFYNSGGQNGTPSDEVIFIDNTNKFTGGLKINGKTQLEQSGWVSYIGNVEDENGGGARTQNSDACYTVTFEGTSLAIYAGSYPFQSKDNQYGDFTVYLDGELLQSNNQLSRTATLTQTNQNDSTWQWTGGSSVQILKIDTGSNVDEKHTVTVINSTFNRVDYAIVGRQTPKIDQSEYYTISSELVEGGSLSATTTKAKEGKLIDVVTFPSAGYILQEGSVTAVTESGKRIDVTKNPNKSGWYTFNMPNENVSLSAVFEPENSTYNVSASVKNNIGGKVEVQNSVVNFLSDAVFTITPDENYKVAEIRVNGISKPLPSSNKYTVTGVKEDILLEVTFEPFKTNTHTVSASLQGGAGYVNSSQKVEDRTDATIQYQPNAGYILGSITVNGEPYPIDNTTGQANTAIIHNVTENIDAQLNLVSDTTTIIDVPAQVQGEGGTIWPTNQLVSQGNQAVLFVYPNEGYNAVKATYNGVEYPITNNKVLVDVNNTIQTSRAVTNTADTILVEFAQQQYTITPSVDVTNGTITVQPQTAASGDTVTLTVTPNQGYEYVSGSISVLDANGGQVAVNTTTANEVFNFIMPSSNVTITAQFEKIPTQETVQNIVITPNAVTLTQAGQTAQLTATMTPQIIGKVITWTSADPNIATVDSNGLVTAISNGTTTIFAQADLVTVPCTVQVNIASNIPNTPSTPTDNTIKPPADATTNTQNNSQINNSKPQSVIVSTNDTINIVVLVGIIIVSVLSLSGLVLLKLTKKYK